MTIEHTRLRLVAANAQRRWEHYSRRRSEIGNQITVFQNRINASVGVDTSFLQATVQHLQNMFSAATDTSERAEVELDTTTGARDRALAVATPLWATEAPPVPIALFPLRLETRYLAAGPTAELLIRAYPDEIHVDAFDPRLSQQELDLAASYWAKVTADPGSGDAAWRQLLVQLAPARAAWAVEQLRPPQDPAQVPTRRPGEVPVAGSRLLPERLVFSGYRRGQLIWRVEGREIPPNLALGMDPAAVGPDAEDVAGDRLPWTGLSRWLIDFDEAVRLGMAVRVPLGEGPLNLDLLTVVGVAAADPATGARCCGDTLLAHQYTKGLGFLAPGTPTNNTPSTRSGWSSRPTQTTPQEAERRRGEYAPGGASDPARLAAALGLDGRPVLALLDGQSPDEAGDLPEALALVADWTRISAHLFGDPKVAAEWVVGGQPLVDHFRAHVRARGPLPTLRVGRQPYGVLPATSLALWQGTDVPELIVVALRTLIAHATLEPVGARVNRAVDQDAAFLDVLTRVPRSSRAWFSTVSNEVGNERVGPSLFGWIDLDQPARWLVADAPDAAEPPMRVAEEVPDSLRAVLQGGALGALGDLIDQIAQIVEQTPAGQDPDLGPAFAALEQRFGQLTDADRLRELIGSSQYVALAMMFAFWWPLRAGGVVAAREQAKAAGDAPGATSLDALFQVIRGIATTIGELQAGAAQDLPRLDGLIAEAIDAASHRIDAWMTSLATARLGALRTTAPEGLRIGAYGWLEDLYPRPPGQRAAADGWVMAPSLHHAVTAAVLRSGWLAHEDRKAFAVDLSSVRLRRARAMLEGVAAGQTMSMLLGYQLERALHEHELDGLIDDYRAVFPLATGGDPARAVADGEAVRQARASIAAQTPGTERLLPPADDAQGRAAMLSILADLDDAVDAVGDLLLAEGVHQLVGGSAERAAVSVDALAHGEKPPLDPDVLRTPRRGTSVACRVAVLFPSHPVDGWNQDRARARLAPEVEAWAAALLGPASGWTATVSVAGADTTVTLDRLGVAALDVVAEATEPVTSSRLAARIAAAVQGGSAEPVLVSGTELDDLATLCGHLRGVLASAQPLLSGAFADEPGLGWDAADLESIRARVADWAAKARASAAQLEVAAAAVRDGGDDASAVVAAATELSELGVIAASGFDAVADPARAGLDLAARVAAAALDPEPVPADPAARPAWHARTLAEIRSLLGGWLMLAPGWPTARGGAGLAGDHQPAGAGEEQARDWLAARRTVRPSLAAMDDLCTCGEIIGAAGPTHLVIAQEPFTPGSAWVGDSPPSGNGVATIVFADSPGGHGDSVSGLLIDEWVEVVPAGVDRDGRTSEVAAAAFNVERPDAQAPQAVLLAVPPDLSRAWVEEDLHAIVEETFALSRIRTLDAVDLPELRWTIPW